ncbi:hypothetical protein ACFYZJ_03540 [Streptomyces sp. NPDC001848]|uniref:hypothetical protein n=1 Tax=Streptomyces sp. NPDC001848 TaxID=3364618 RepID=UPI0036ACBD4C
MTNESPRPRGARARALHRGAATLLALTMLLQVGFGAGYISGDYDSMDMHRLNARVMVVVGLLTFISALWLRRVGGPVRAVATSAAMVVALVLQMVLGVERVVAVHVTLGVLIASAVTLLVMRAWTMPVPTGARRPAVTGRASEPVS